MPISFKSLEEQLADTVAANPDVPPRCYIEFRSPAQCREYTPPPGAVLVGENHVVRGSVFVVGGAPGVGKSRAGVALAVAGATGQSWFGYSVKSRFKTMIIQNENGPLRLRDEFSNLTDQELNDYIRISPPPPFGMLFDNVEFCSQVSRAIADFTPDVVLIDPWNAVARDDRAKDYLATFTALRSVIPAGDNGPALGIIAHTRKPKPDERSTGRGLMNTLAGSYVLASVPRAVFVLQAASDDPEDDRVVFTCCKNNDGPLGSAGAWKRRNGLFLPVHDFDWDEFNGSPSSNRSITEGDIVRLFHDGARRLTRNQAVRELEILTGKKEAACYRALQVDGRFARLISEIDGFLALAGVS